MDQHPQIKNRFKGHSDTNNNHTQVVLGPTEETTILL